MRVWNEAISFAEVWSRTVAARSSHSFLVFEGPDGSATEWTYQEFNRVVSRVASALVDRGVEPGSSVHLALTNSPIFVALWLATIRLGAWIVPSDPMAKQPELADHVSRTKPTIGFCSTERAELYRAAADEAMPVVLVDEADVGFQQFPLIEFGDWPQIELTDRAAVMFTSGTTGKPKGVEVTQANYAFAGNTMASACELEPSDRQLVVLPLFHANAQYYSFASAIWAGASVALMHTFSASGFLAQAERHQATCASLFAAPIRMILARGAKVEGVALRHCWFA
ncbi:MAG: AMP-binding protein, partial [Acidimicrobiales bacterium]